MAALGLAVALGQAPFGLWSLALLALAAAIMRASAASTIKAAFGAGFWLGVGYSALTFIWIAEPFFVDPWATGWMAPFAVAAMAAGLGLFWGAGAALGLWLGGAGQLGRALGLALGLSAVEALRSYVFTGFPWALIGQIWIDTAFYQLAAWAGPLGVTLITVVMAATLAHAWRQRHFVSAFVSVALLVAGFGLGYGVQSAPRAPANAADAAGAAPIFRLVQPNALQHQKWDPAYSPIFFERQLAFSAEPGAADLVIWPEVAVTFRLEDRTAPYDEMARAAGGVPLVFGAQSVRQGQAFNSLAVLDATGAITQSYDKTHLVPFGEYIPGGGLLESLGLRGLAQQMPVGFTPGPGPRLLDFGALGKALPMICYEAIFPHELRRVPERPDWLLHVTNDAWFGEFSGPFQHLAQARARAIEFGLPVVRVANTGVSAMIDARGNILSALDLGQAGYLDAPLPPARAATLYWLWGDIPAFLVWIVMLAAIRTRQVQNHVDRPRHVG